MISLWIVSIFVSILTISVIYYTAYKKNISSDAAMMAVMAVLSLVMGFIWSMAIDICNMDNFDIGDSVDEMMLSIFGPMIGVAIIHFIILLPAYFIYKDNNAK